MAVFLASAENVLTNWRGLFPEAEVEHYVFPHESGAGQNWSLRFGQCIRRGHIGSPKTEAREAAVPVAPLLQEILAKYKTNKDFPSVDEGWMFYGQKEKKPINMDDLSRREISQFINGGWFGWHAFRRGLGTRLNDMGMNGVDIQRILRHANIATTLGYYTFPNPEKTKTGLKKLTEAVRKKYKVKV